MLVSTLAADEPASIVAKTYWQKIVDGDNDADAFKAAITATLTKTALQATARSSPSTLLGTRRRRHGFARRHNNWQMAKKGDLSGVLPSGHPFAGRQAAGIAVLICRHRFKPLASGAPPPLPHEVRGHAAFTGRSAQVDALRDTFFPIQRVTADSQLQAAVPTRQAILQAIRGLGGVGKTELAGAMCSRTAATTQPACFSSQPTWRPRLSC